MVISSTMSDRKLLDINSHLIWRFIKYLVNNRHFNVTFTKVKAHSGDPNNDTADLLAKESQVKLPININPKYLPSALLTPIWNHLGPIDKNIRKWFKHLTD